MRPKPTGTLGARTMEIAQAPASAVYNLLNTSKTGLSEETVWENRKRYGLNEVAHEKPPAWYLQLINAFINPFTAILVVVGIMSLFSDIIFAAPTERSWETIIILTIMIMISGSLRFWQEFQSNQAAQKLKAMVRTTASVLRAHMNKPAEIPIAELVPGDIIQLSAGDMTPADVRILSSKDLFISQAVLTGESMPVEKFSTSAEIKDSQNPLELSNLCFMGTNVISGSATAAIITTGNGTYFGSLAKSIVGKRPPTSFDKGINQVSWLLISIMLIMIPLVLVINGLTKNDWLEALLFSLSIAVGLTPEMLPMIVTANLARGAVKMAKHKTIIKRLNAIQNFGAMNILCTDKTGTLTQNRIILEKHLDIHGKNSRKVLEYAYLNSFHQTGLRNLLDNAVLEHGGDKAIKKLQKIYSKVDEIPFDFMRRRMSVVVQQNPDEHLLVCKGAVEEILGICTGGYYKGRVVPLNKKMISDLQAMSAELYTEGLRVLAVAYKVFPHEDRAYGTKDEFELVLAGFIAFLDPPKETAAKAIAALNEHGVEVKIITGDNEIITYKICKEVNLSVEKTLLGNEVEAMSDEELADVAEYTQVFAKMSPLQKARVIRAMQSRGHTVGYLGDGINDAPALRDADVGISVDTAVDIAKESADIILLEKDLMVLEAGVLEGRKTFGNIIKYIKMTVSSNFGNVFSVLIASAFLPFLPMLSIHILLQNLLYDTSQISIPWDHVDKKYLSIPRKWEANDIVRFMICVGPISSIFDITTFYLMWHIFGANTPDMQSLFQSGWFVEGLLSQTLIVHMIRTQKIPFIQSMPATPVLVLTLLIMAIGIAIPFSPLGAKIGLAPLPLAYFGWLILTLFCYCTLTQLVKFWYIKRFTQWL